jgi:hypothetical protein
MANRKKIDKLFEEFLDGIKHMGRDYKEIYVNPTESEMDEVAEIVEPHEGGGANDPGGAWMKYQKSKKEKYIRFTATANKKVYVFSPWIMHEDLDKKLGVKQTEAIFIHGIAKKVNGKWTMVEAHNVEYVMRSKEEDRKKDYASHDWSWLDRYILTTPMYNKLVNKK